MRPAAAALSLALLASSAAAQAPSDAELVRMVRERRTPSGKTLAELAGPGGRWSVHPAAEGRVVALVQGARRLEWLYDGKALQGVAPNRLDPSLPVWAPDHAAVLAKVRDLELPGGKTLRQAAVAKVAATRKSAWKGREGACLETRAYWIVDPAPKDALGYLVTYRWDGLACRGAAPGRKVGAVTLEWVWDGKAVFAYGPSGALDRSIPLWKRRRPAERP